MVARLQSLSTAHLRIFEQENLGTPTNLAKIIVDSARALKFERIFF